MRKGAAISPTEWAECLRHEARGALILLHGIDEPTEREIAAYLLYGERSVPERAGDALPKFKENVPKNREEAIFAAQLEKREFPYHEGRRKDDHS